MEGVILLFAIGTAIFVGYNIGGATTGPAFGPAVGAGVISKISAAGLMSIFFFVGAWFLGREVVLTLGDDIVGGADVFTVETAAVVLLFIGLALFVGNWFGVPASTSMTAVGAISALGYATGSLNRAAIGEIVTWWIVAPIIGFWISGVIGRYFYPRFNQWLALEQSDGKLLKIAISSGVPQVALEPNTTRREVVGSVIVIGVGCLMAASSGASNIANAIAPLYGADVAGFGMEPLILTGSAAVAVGAFTIARRTLETLGNDITELPLAAAIIVAVVSSALVTGLAAIGIPASFVIIATMSIVGLGWGRASRTVTMSEGVQGKDDTTVSVGALTADEPGESPSNIGDESSEDIPEAAELFDPATTGRVIILQNVVPILSTVGAYVTFYFLLRFGMI